MKCRIGMTSVKTGASNLETKKGARGTQSAGKHMADGGSEACTWGSAGCDKLWRCLFAGGSSTGTRWCVSAVCNRVGRVWDKLIQARNKPGTTGRDKVQDMYTVSVTLTTRDGQPWVGWLATSCGAVGRDPGPDGDALVVTAGDSSAWDGGGRWDGTGHLRPFDRSWQCWSHRVSPDEHALSPGFSQSVMGQGPRSNVSGSPMNVRCWLAPLHFVPKGQCRGHKGSPLVHLQKPGSVQAPTRQLLFWRAVDGCDPAAVDAPTACVAPACVGRGLSLGTGATQVTGC